MLWICNVVRYHGFIGEENTSLITNWTTSHIQSICIMFSPLFCSYWWCYSQWMGLQAGLRHPISYQPSAVLRKITFLYRHYWSVVILLIARVIKTSYSFEVLRFRPSCFVLYSVFAVIILHMVFPCTPQIWTTAEMDRSFSHKFLMISLVSFCKYVNLRWFFIVFYNTK